MKKSFLKPFAATVGAILTASTASAAVAPIDTGVSTSISGMANNLAGASLTLQHVDGSFELAAHGSHSSHASHASHASHSSHASSSY